MLIIVSRQSFGREGDSTIFKKSNFGRRLLNNELDILMDSPLPVSEQCEQGPRTPYVGTTVTVSFCLVKDLMKKWKAIRDSFVKDHKTNTATGTGQAALEKNVYHDQLLFLLPHVKGNLQTTSNIAPLNLNQVNEGEEQIQGIQIDYSVGLHTHEETRVHLMRFKKASKRKIANQNITTGKALERIIDSSTKDLTNILASSLELQREERNSDKFGHKAFLNSFVPVLDSMPFHKSMQLRGQISQVFSNYFSQNEGNGGPSRSLSSLSSTAPATPAGLESDISVDYNISDYLDL